MAGKSTGGGGQEATATRVRYHETSRLRMVDREGHGLRLPAPQ